MNSPSAITGLLAQMSAPVDDPWAEQLLGLDPEQRFSLIIVTIGCVTGIIVTLGCLLAAGLSKAHHRRIEAELKREMLDRGMSAEEVARVIEASAPDETTSHLKAIYGRK